MTAPRPEPWGKPGRPRRGPARSDRAYGVDVLRAWLAQQVIEAVIPARARCTNLQPHASERYKTRNAVERGPRLAQTSARYDPYAQHGPGFLYLKAAWIWLNSKISTLPGRGEAAAAPQNPIVYPKAIETEEARGASACSQSNFPNIYGVESPRGGPARTARDG